MRCPYCHFNDSKVIDSRELSEGLSIRRRRECLGCGQRYTTYERLEPVSLTVVKKDGRREEYDRRKLSEGIRKACTKRAIPTEALNKMIEDIESELFALGEAEVPSNAIGEIVMRHLRELDQVAYIRFASVYRPFGDLESMRREMELLRKTE
ncbi:MAG: transcriptional regulator NrdR [Chloroflexi bacterium]|nr:transcriptional regulator NrdR [Chloroflexota bacterium]